MNLPRFFHRLLTFALSLRNFVDGFAEHSPSNLPAKIPASIMIFIPPLMASNWLSRAR